MTHSLPTPDNHPAPQEANNGTPEALQEALRDAIAQHAAFARTGRVDPAHRLRPYQSILTLYTDPSDPGQSITIDADITDADIPADHDPAAHLANSQEYGIRFRGGWGNPTTNGNYEHNRNTGETLRYVPASRGPAGDPHQATPEQLGALVDALRTGTPERPHGKVARTLGWVGMGPLGGKSAKS